MFGGTRLVAIVKHAEMMECMAEQKIDSSKQAPALARTYWRSMGKEALKAYVASRRLAQITIVGPGDLLYTPSGAIFAEM